MGPGSEPGGTPGREGRSSNQQSNVGARSSSPTFPGQNRSKLPRTDQVSCSKPKKVQKKQKSQKKNKNNINPVCPAPAKDRTKGESQTSLHQFFNHRTEENKVEKREITPNIKQQINKKHSQKVSFTQINLHGAKVAWDTLLIKIVRDTNPIILATEPYSLKNNKIPVIQNDLLPFYQKNGGKKPRAAILIHKGLADRSWELTQFTTADQVAIKLEINKKEVVLCSVYMEGGKKAPIPPPDLAGIIEYTNKHKLPLIMGSDTNSHHYMWGDRKTDKRGEKLLDYLNSQGLGWANKGSKPTFLNSRGHNTVIDLTIHNDAGSEMIENWEISDEEPNSDHRYIQFSVEEDTSNQTQQKRNAINTDWNKLMDNMGPSEEIKELEDLPLTCSTEVNTASELLVNTINKYQKEACPPTYTSSKIKPPHWLTPEVRKVGKGVKKSLNKARKSKSKPDWLIYREKVVAYQKQIRKIKSSKWRKFCKDTESTRENARMNNILKNMDSPKEKLEAVTKGDGTLSKTPMETLQVMSEVHFQGAPCQEQKQPPVQNNTMPKKAPTDLLDRMFEKRRICDVVKSFGPLKAPGPDGIQPITIQKTWGIIGPIVLRILRACHKLNYTPEIWMEANGIFLPKPGKTDYHSPKSFRTITLTSIFLKIHEKCVKWYMDFDLDLPSLSSEKQYGFKKGCSTETALHKVVRCIEKRIAKKGFVMGTFLDIEGAFDNISFDAISRAIHNSPIDETTAGWISYMVNNRYVSITHKNKRTKIRITRGCPQGGILSPFLWNLVVDDLLGYSANEIPGYLQAFADDLVSLVEGQDLSVIRARSQKTVNTIETWCKANGLNISALKTKTVMFTRKNKWTPPKPLKVGGIEIELSSSVKFLGVTLDKKLTFKNHINNITKKATASLMQCKRAVGPTWGLSPQTCNWMYRTAIRPILSYSSVIWINALKNQSNTKKLEKVQRMALSIASGALPGTARTNLDKLTDTPSIANFLKGEAAKGAARLKAYGNWTIETNPNRKGSIRFHSTTNNKFIKDLNLPAAEMDLTTTRLNLKRKYGSVIPERNTQEQILKEIHEDEITCYTDGSKTEDGTGFGFIITTKQNKTELAACFAKLPDHCSVYQAELIAINKAAEIMQTQNTRQKQITFFTDSQSAIESLEKTTMNSRTAIECHQALNALGDHNTVKVSWIAGHEGHWGNEKADELAKKGTKGSSPITGYLPQSLIKRQINQKVKELDAVNWANKGPKHCKQALNNKQNHVKSMTRIQTKREDYRIATQLLTGHAGLNSHLFKMKITTHKTCEQCEEEDETVQHFLGKCPAFYNLRMETFHTHIINKEDIFNYSLYKIIKYAKKTKRLVYDPTRGDSVT